MHLVSVVYTAFFPPALGGMQDFIFLTEGQTITPAGEAHSLNHWTTKEVPSTQLFDCVLGVPI